MSDARLLGLFLDSMKNPFLFTDTDHVIRYMNKAATKYYDDGAALIGRSLFDCHNEESCRVMREVLVELQAGADEQMITDNEKYRIYMRAVRDEQGEVIGYYERYEPPIASIG